MDGLWQRGGTVTGRRGLGGIARERITRSLPVAPARASASGRAALSLLLQPPPRPSHPPSSALSSRVWSWRLDSLVARFSDPLFHREPLSLPLSLSVSLFSPCPRTPSTIRCRTSVQRNFAQWRNLAITITCPYSPVILYRLYFSLTGVTPHRNHLSLSSSFLIRARVALCKIGRAHV